MNDLSWHQPLWDYLQTRHGMGSLPHALLLQGQAGLGKDLFARQLAKRLLCQDAGALLQKPCGKCKSCLLMQADNHPDFLELGPEEDSKEIKVDQVRDLISWQTLKSHYGGMKVVLLQEAHKLNRNAANAILKTLEEPASGTVVLLLTENPGRLLATIRSRCQPLRFSLPDREESIKYLEKQVDNPEQRDLLLSLSGGAPLRALAIARGEYLQERQAAFKDLSALSEGKTGVMDMAAKWHKTDQNQLYSWFQDWCRDMIRLKFTPGSSLIVNSDIRPGLAKMAERVSLHQLYHWYDCLQEGQRLTSTNVSPQLQLESTLIHWWHTIKQRSKTIA